LYAFFPRKITLYIYRFLANSLDQLSELSIVGSQFPISSGCVVEKGVNTETTYYSLKRWHGANWQKALPQMYLPRNEKYDAYNSNPIRTKDRPTRYRDSSEMFPT